MGFSFEVMSVLDISGNLFKKVFMFNIVISYVSILLLCLLEVLDIIKKEHCIYEVIKTSKYLEKNNKI